MTLEKNATATKSIGLIYGSSTCYTEIASEKIAPHLSGYKVDIFNIANTGLTPCENYNVLIMGIPTWDYGELQEDWEACWSQLDEIDFSNKTIALFGLGDQIGYPEWFLDAMGYLHSKLIIAGARLIGYTSIQGFTFDESKALTPDGSQFVGLALDEENEFDKTDERITAWVNQIIEELAA